jgi:hypothetical protein
VLSKEETMAEEHRNGTHKMATFYDKINSLIEAAFLKNRKKLIHGHTMYVRVVPTLTKDEKIRYSKCKIY